MQKTYRYAVTFEKPLSSAPATARGEVAANSAGTAMRRAFQAACRQMPRRQWDSLVVLLERVDEVAPAPDDKAVA
jgi:hypothetical protein